MATELAREFRRELGRLEATLLGLNASESQPPGYFLARCDASGEF